MDMSTDFKTLTLDQKPELKDQLISLIEKEFSYPSDCSYKVDFFPLINEKNYKNLHLLMKDEKIIGHIGVKKRLLTYQGNDFPVALIGGVVIDKQYQGQGLFSEFFNNTIETYTKNVAFFFLWSALDQLYEKYDFYEFGLIREILGDEFNEDQNQDYSQSGQLTSDFKELYHRHNKEFLSLKRTDHEWEEFSQIQSSKFYLSGDKQSYFIKDKGADFQGIIHEIQPTPKDSWSHRTWICNSEYKEGENYRYMGLIRLGDPKLFKNCINHITNKSIQIHSSSKELIKFSMDDQEYELSIKQFMQGAFGPKFINELTQKIPKISIYGLDSV
ncbi:GNAT family N-acetyltransferase [bacterium]|nr:GNAT family N-acetyltransferase [bacterium]